MDKKNLKNQGLRENRIRIQPIPSTWTCRNAACKAVLSIVDTFCKRCSCCICHLYDDNKDPSLWLECGSDSSSGSCGLCCHVECALHQRKVGVVDFDGSYSCASCGKISGILGFWKKQLTIAMDCRRVDNLCYRVYLCFKLLDGTLRFQELHEYVKEAKSKLESEVGPLGGVLAKLARGLVCRLSVAEEVQALCIAAIQKVDDVSASLSRSLDGKEVSITAAAFKPNNNKNNAVVTVPQNEGTSGAKDPEPDSAFRVRDHGKIPLLTWVDTSGPELSGQTVKPNTSKANGPPSMSKEFPDSENWAQHGINEEGRAGVSRKRLARTEAHGFDSAMIHTPPLPAHTGGPDNLGQNLEYCMMVIRGLEREGHITREFRRKLLTWFGLRSTEHERRVVNAFIRTLGDDPPSLAEQLGDSFGDIITNN